MFNFVEKKSFFYFSAIVSVLLSFCVFFSLSGSFKSAFINILVICMLIAMMILYNYEHKEVMKVLLTSFFTILMFSRIDYLFRAYFAIKDITIEAGYFDSIRYTINNAFTTISGIIVPVLFINHFILNYNGKNSKIVININKILIIVMALSTIVVVISNIVVSSKAGLLMQLTTYRMVGSVCTLLFYCMTIVSAEAFINSRRAEKVAAESKVSKSSKKKKSKKSKKSK